MSLHTCQAGYKWKVLTVPSVGGSTEQLVLGVLLIVGGLHFGTLLNMSAKVKQAYYLLLPDKPLQPTMMHYFSQFSRLFGGSFAGLIH